MKIQFHKNFIKNYNARFSGKTSLKRRLRERTDMFLENSASPTLKDHSLKGKYAGKRAFSVTGDIRVVYTIVGKTVYFLDIGTHNQVY